MPGINSKSDIVRFKHNLLSPITTLMCLSDEIKTSQISDASRKNIQIAIRDLGKMVSWRNHPDESLGKETFSLKNLLSEFSFRSNHPQPFKILVNTTDIGSFSLYGHRYLLKSAIGHLINNAREAYQQTNAMRVVKLSATKSLGGVLISIHDFACGMSFWQAKLCAIKWISFKKVKSGLGFWEAKKILENDFAGIVDLMTIKNIGTTVHIYLPGKKYC